MDFSCAIVKGMKGVIQQMSTLMHVVEKTPLFHLVTSRAALAALSCHSLLYPSYLLTT